MNKISNLSSLALSLLLTWIAASTPAIAQSSGEPTVESKVFQRLVSSADAFDDVLKEAGAKLPEDLSRRVGNLTKLAEQGRTDPKAAAEYHETLSGIMTDLMTNIDKIIDAIPNIKLNLNEYRSELDSGRARAEANLSNEQMEYTDTQAILHEKEQALVRVSLKAKQLRDAGRLLPFDLQQRLKRAAQDRDAAERRMQDKKKNCKYFKDELSLYDQLVVKLNVREEQLAEYWRFIDSDRDTLQISARGHLSSLNGSRLQAAFRRDHDNLLRDGDNQRLRRKLFDHLEADSVDHHPEKGVEFDAPENKNREKTDEIIDRWAKEELIQDAP